MKYYIAIIFCIFCLIGCRKSTPSLETKPQISLDWGKSGSQPDKVWSDYNWIIMSQDYYQSSCK